MVKAITITFKVSFERYNNSCFNCIYDLTEDNSTRKKKSNLVTIANHRNLRLFKSELITFSRKRKVKRYAF